MVRLGVRCVGLLLVGLLSTGACGGSSGRLDVDSPVKPFEAPEDEDLLPDADDDDDDDDAADASDGGEHETTPPPAAGAAAPK